MEKRSVRKQSTTESFAGGGRGHAKADRQSLAQALERPQTVGITAHSEVTAHRPLVKILGEIIDLKPLRIPVQRGIPVVARFTPKARRRYELDELRAQALPARYRPRGVGVRIEKVPYVKRKCTLHVLLKLFFLSSFRAAASHEFERPHVTPY